MQLQDLFKEGLIIDVDRIPATFQIRTSFLNEKGLYSIAMHTRNPSVALFKKWMIDTVLPAVRRHGVPIGNATTNTPRIREIVQEDEQDVVQENVKGVQEVQMERSNAEHAINFTQQLLHYPGKEPIHFLIDKNGDPWFPAAQVAKLFGFKALQSAILHDVKNHQGNDVYILALKDLYKEPYDVDKKSLHKNVWVTTEYLNEKGLYSLAIHCRIAAGAPLKKWIIDIVLPAIRGHGIPTDATGPLPPQIMQRLDDE